MSYALDQIAGLSPSTETLSLGDFLKSGWEPLPLRQGRVPGESEMRNMSTHLIPKQPTIRSKKFDVSTTGVNALVGYVVSMLPKGHNVEIMVETHPRRVVVIFYCGETVLRFASNTERFKVATSAPRDIAKKYRSSL